MENPKNIKRIFDSFDNIKALIIGDVMLDSYLWGNVNRISPEAPVPIVALDKRENRLGGAANVALNIQSLGAKPILCSIVGQDHKSEQFYELMKKKGIDTSAIIKSSHRKTTSKFRIIGNNMQMLRVDEESIIDLQNDEIISLVDVIKGFIKHNNVDVIIFEDYDKGIISPELISKVSIMADEEKIPIVVDPKKNNFLNYQNVTLFKPNLKELKEGLKIDIEPDNQEQLTAALNKLLYKINANTGLLTLSDKGILICSRSKNSNSYSCQKIPAHIRNISDVSGAGDTVISVAALCTAIGLKPELLAKLSNIAGGLVCESVGVIPIDKKRFLDESIKILCQHEATSQEL